MLTASVKFNIAFIFRLYSGSMKVQELPQEKRIRWPLWGLSKWILSWRCVLLKLLSITRQWWWYWFGIMLMTDDKHFDVLGGVGGGGCGELVHRWPRHGDTGKDSQLEKWYKCQLRHHQRQHHQHFATGSNNALWQTFNWWWWTGFDGDISTRHGKRADGKTTAKLRRFWHDLIPGH